MAFKTKKGLAYRRVGGELFVVDGAAGKLHELNGSAALIWEGLAAGKTEARIAGLLAEEFEVDLAGALADVKGFAAELARAGLVEER